MHYIRYDVLYQAVLERLQYWAKAVQQDEEKVLNKIQKAGNAERIREKKKKASTLKKAENRQVDESLLQGKDMYFVFQGYAPTKEQLAAGEYTMNRFAKLYGMNYKGMTTE